MVVLCNIQVLVTACRILVILDSDAVPRRRAIVAAAAARPRRGCRLRGRVGRFKCHPGHCVRGRRPAPPTRKIQVSPGHRPPGPNDSEGSSVTRAIVQPVARARAPRRGLQPGHNLGRPGRAWATGSEPLPPIFRVTDQAAALNAAPRPVTQAGRAPSGWPPGPDTDSIIILEIQMGPTRTGARA